MLNPLVYDLDLVGIVAENFVSTFEMESYVDYKHLTNNKLIHTGDFDIEMDDIQQQFDLLWQDYTRTSFLNLNQVK